MLNRCLSAVKTIIKSLSILFLFLIAVYVLASRFILNMMPEYTEEIEQYISSQLNYPVTIGSFTSRWEALNPVLDVHRIKVHGSEPLYFDHARLQFAFWSSLITLSPRFESVLIEQAELTLKQHQDGDWFLLLDKVDNDSDNITLNNETQPTNQSWLSLVALFNGTRINLKNIQTTIYKHNGTKRTLRLPTLNVNYQDNQLFASGQILETRGQKPLLNFSLQGRDLFAEPPFKGTLYLEARSSELFGELMSIYEWQQLSIQNIEASVRAWINFEDLEISTVSGDIQVSEMNWKIAEKTLPPIHDLAFSYHLQQSSGEYSLSFDGLGYAWGGLMCDHGALNLFLTKENMAIQAEKLNLQCVNKLALSLDLVSENLNARLFQSDPHGYLKNINLNIVREPAEGVEADLSVSEENTNSQDAKSGSFTLEAELDKVSLLAFGGTPSGKNISGYLFADNHSGYVSFLSEQFELGFPNLFLEPWELVVAEGSVSWKLSENEALIYSDGLRLWREDKSLIYGDFSLRLNPDDEEDYLALAIGMQDIKFTDAVKFVPYHAVDMGLYQWLSESLVNGHVSDGVYYGYGSVETNASENSFTSSILLNTSKGELKFDPLWPSLRRLDAQIILQNGQLEINGKQGLMEKTALSNIYAHLPEGQKGQANFLDIRAESRVENEQINYWLRDSPIADALRSISEQLNVTAKAVAKVSLKIPVVQAAESQTPIDTAYQVNVLLDGGDIEHIPSRLNFTKVQGELVVDSDKGVSAKGLALEFFRKPASLQIKTEKVAAGDDNQNASQLTQLKLNGSLGVADIFGYFDAPKPPSLLGELNFSALLSLSDQENKYPMITMESDLIGMSCLCPAPFFKASEDREKLLLSMLLKPDQTSLETRIRSSHWPSIDMALSIMENQVSSGEILIGGASLSNTQSSSTNSGLKIAAKLDKINIISWLDYLVDDFQLKTSASPDNESIEPSLLKQLQLHVESIDAYDYRFNTTTLIMSPEQSGQWKVDLAGKDIRGLIRLAQAEKPLSFNLEKLNLKKHPLYLTPLSEQKNNSSTTKTDPRNFPKIDFNTKDLLLEGRSIGSWRFLLEPDQGGTIFKNLSGNFKGTSINGQINWRFEPDTERTMASFDMQGKDIATVFDILQLPDLISSERFKTDVALVWPSAPYDFSLANLSGKVALNMESGFIKTEDEKTGALRLFGVLNAESIKRRLKLDFSDLYKSGVGYDTFRGAATLDNGLLTLTEPLEIDGPAGSYLVNGRSDLATKTLDFDMLVELPFSQNFPLAALVLGAPQVGGLVWVADKLLGEPLSALTTSRYDITGAWEQPRVDLHQAVNASKKDRSKEKGLRDSRQSERQ